MWARLSIVAGFVVGVVAAGLLLGGLLAFTPETPPPSVAVPTAAAASASAVPTAAAASASTVPTAAAPPSAAEGLESILPGVVVTP